jgi:hypothetical protein
MHKRKQTLTNGWAHLPADVLQKLPLDPGSHMRSGAVSRHYREALQQTVHRALKVEITPVVTMASADAQPQISLLGVPDLKAIDADIRKQAARLQAQDCPCMKLHLRITVPFIKQERFRIPPAAYEQQRAAFRSVFEHVAQWVNEALLTVVSFSCVRDSTMNLEDALPLLNRIQNTILYLRLHEDSRDWREGTPSLLSFIGNNDGFHTPLLHTADIAVWGEFRDHNTVVQGALERLLRSAPQLRTLALEGNRYKLCRDFCAAAKNVFLAHRPRLPALRVVASRVHITRDQWLATVEGGKHCYIPTMPYPFGTSLNFFPVCVRQGSCLLWTTLSFMYHGRYSNQSTTPSSRSLPGY